MVIEGSKLHLRFFQKDVNSGLRHNTGYEIIEYHCGCFESQSFMRFVTLRVRIDVATIEFWGRG